MTEQKERETIRVGNDPIEPTDGISKRTSPLIIDDRGKTIDSKSVSEQSFSSLSGVPTIAICFAVGGLTLYFWNFWGNGLSPLPSEWGVFGDYVNWIIGLLNLSLLYKITNIANEIQKKIAREEIDNQRRLLTLQIYFDTVKRFVGKVEDLAFEYQDELSKFSDENSDEENKSIVSEIERKLLMFREAIKNEKHTFDIFFRPDETIEFEKKKRVLISANESFASSLESGDAKAFREAWFDMKKQLVYGVKIVQGE